MMKYIITENRLKHLIDKFISYKIGELTKKTSEEYPESIFWVDNNNEVKLESESSGELWVDDIIWDSISNMFSLNYEQTHDAIKSWSKDVLKLNTILPIEMASMFKNKWRKLSNLK